MIYATPGNTLVAPTGASLADLMARMGLGSARAAMIYQHDTVEVSDAIADALTERMREHREKRWHANGTTGRFSNFTTNGQARHQVSDLAFGVERVTGIEPAPPAWNAGTRTGPRDR